MRALTLTSILCLTLLAAAWAAYSTPSQPGGVRGGSGAAIKATHEVSIVESASGTAVAGLRVGSIRLTQRPSGSVYRTLIPAPGYHAIVLTDVWEPTTGRTLTRLLDEDAGWWLEWWGDTGVIAADAERALEISQSRDAWWNSIEEQGSRMERVALRTSGGAVLDRVVNVATADFGVSEFLRDVRNSRQWESLAQEIPVGADPALMLVRALAEDELSFEVGKVAPEASLGHTVAKTWMPVATVAYLALRDGDRVAAKPKRSQWSLSVGMPAKDPHSVSLLQVASKFASIDPVDPLPEDEVIELLNMVRKRPPWGSSGSSSTPAP